MRIVERLRRDVAFSARLHARTPLASACVVVTLAVGMAATSVAVALISAFFVRPLPVADAGRLVRVYRHSAASAQHLPLRYGDFEEVRALGVFSGTAAEQPAPLILGGAGTAERTWGEIVSPGYFSELGLTPLHGRFFDPAEERDGVAVAVIGEGLWARQFGRDRGALGAEMRVDGRSYRVIGVAPAEFHGTVLGFASQLWIPVRAMPDARGEYGDAYFTIAKLAPDVAIGDAQHALDALARRLDRERPGSHRGVRLSAFREASGRIPPPFREGFAGFSILGLGVALLVTAVAAANTAGVLLARAVTRRREMAVRLALGASRRSIVEQLLAEGAVLAIPAAVAGVAIAWQVTRLMSAFDVPIARGAELSFDVSLDGLALAAALAVTAGVVLLIGLTPALESSRLDLVSALRDAQAHHRRRSWSRALFLTAQVAVSMVLLAGCAALFRSVQHARAIDPGFDPAGVVTTAVDLRASRSAGDPGFWLRLADEIRRLPRVDAASLASRVPLELGVVMTSLAPEGHGPATGADWPSVEFAIVDVGYLATMRIPLIEGREFDAGDRRGSPAVAVINDVLARRFWGHANVVGRGLVTRDGGRLQVVGVVRHSKYLSLGESPKPYLYLPLRQGDATAMTIVARTAAGEPAALLRAIADTVRRLEPDAPLYEATTMSRKVAMSLAPARGGALGLAVVAAMALALTAVGLFGVVAQAVSRRTFEIGVRRALGAADGRVVWLIVRDTMTPVLTGCVLGLLAAVAVQPMLRVVLYDVNRFDPLVVGLAPGVIVTVCSAAAWLPSRRATLISPTAALRRE